MSAIAGAVRWRGQSQVEVDCVGMLSRLRPFGNDGEDSRPLGPACFGRVLSAALPEDRLDKQPLIGGHGRLLLAADVRIDNRKEVAAELAIPTRALAGLSDSDLLLAAWDRWRLACFGRILGDIAMAVWDESEKRLVLGRSAASLKPLFYCHGTGLVAFASMPQALVTLREIPARPALDEAAAIIAGLPGRGVTTVFAGIETVRHGHAVEICEGGEREVRHWDPGKVERRRLSLADAAEAIRAELDRAVAAQLRRRTGGVACQLSSGRDSGAVTASAALALERSQEDLVALTGCPSAEFAGPGLPDRLADEGPLAALTASRYPNVHHVVCRSRIRDVNAELRQLSDVHFRPLTNPTAVNWATEVEEQAQRRGASIMLIGSTGNLSISASGPAYLIDVLRGHGASAWLRHALPIGGRSIGAWRSIGSISFGPFLPQPLFAVLLRATGRDPGAGMSVPMLRQPYRAVAEDLLRREFGDCRPPRDYHQFRCDLLLVRDNADKTSLALRGLDVRDPTADRRLIELCLSLPTEYLVSRRFAPSPAYAAAFADRIPAAVLRNDRRGLQGADWLLLFGRDQVERCFADYRRSAVVAELLDLREVDRLIESWPGPGSTDFRTISLYRRLLGALAVAQYLSHHFPD